MVQLDAGVWNNTASFGGCTFEWSVSKNADHLFGTSFLLLSHSLSPTVTQRRREPHPRIRFRKLHPLHLTANPIPARHLLVLHLRPRTRSLRHTLQPNHRASFRLRSYLAALREHQRRDVVSRTYHRIFVVATATATTAGTVRREPDRRPARRARI